MLKNQYISLILFLIVVVTLVNLYYKPYLTEQHTTPHWIQNFAHPISKAACVLQGFKCPTDEVCDCDKMCSNGKEFVSFTILEDDRVYVMNQKLSPGTYCLPKGIGKCNLKTSYHFFSLAGWSCIGINDDIFKQNKKKACKNEEAKDNSLNVLWDYKKNEEAGDNIENFYEQHLNDLRFRCKCGSKSLDNTPMISVFPFVCLVDYCLRNFHNPSPLMGWNGQNCECGPYFHLNPDDLTSPCKREISRIENNNLSGTVNCMTEKSFIKQPLICPTDDGVVLFKERVFAGRRPQAFVDMLIT